MRNPVSVSIVNHKEFGKYSAAVVVCNDGSLWELLSEIDGWVWKKLPDIPQDDYDNDSSEMPQMLIKQN